MTSIGFIFRSLWVVFALSCAAAFGIVTGAEAEDINDQWCLQDAPGLYRALRNEARAAGSDAVVCPALEPAIALPPRLVLRLPCDRHISFARIDVDVKTLLGHAETRLGGSARVDDLVSRYTQGLRQSTISGTFSLSDEGPAFGYRGLNRRAYYLAEYELTTLQYDLLVGDALPSFLNEEAPDASTAEFLCKNHKQLSAPLDFRDIEPKVGLSKYEVETAIRNLNLFLMAQSRRQIAGGGLPVIPWEQGSTGFVRLPTEEEWEYAARGGMLSERSSDGSNVFIAKEDDTIRKARLAEIAVVSNGQSRAQVRAVGTRLPNQLGLFDMIGNADELVQNLFRMVRPDALQGARGGLVTRGGNVTTPLENLSYSYRQELPPYSLRGEARAPFMGVRLLISAPILTTGTSDDNRFSENLINSELPEALAAAHSELTSTGGTAGAAERAEAFALLGDLQRDETEGEGAASQLAALQSALERSEAAINVARLAELKSVARSAAMGIMNAHSNSTLTVAVYDARYRAFESLRNVPVGSNDYTRLKQQLEQMQTSVDVRVDLIGFQTRVVLDLLRDLAQADDSLAKEAVDTVKAELRNQGLFVYDQRAWPIFDQALADLESNPGRDFFEKYYPLLDTRREFRETRRRKELSDFPNLAQ